MKKLLCLVMTMIMLVLLYAPAGRSALAASENPGVAILKAKYESLELLTSMETDETKVPLFKYRSGEKYGIVNEKGRLIAKAEYDDIWEYYNGIITVVKNDKVGYINSKGAIISSPQYDLYPANFYDGLAAVHKNGKYGFINTAGKVVIALKYDDAFNFADGAAPVCSDGKWGLIDKKGNYILKPQYAKIGYVGEGSGVKVSFVEGVAQVMDAEGRWGYIDKTGKEIIPPQFDAAYEFCQGYGRYYINNKMGLADKSGIVLPAQYDYIHELTNGAARFLQNNKYGLLNSQMKEILPARYDTMDIITAEGYVTVSKNGKYGVINRAGKTIIEPQYEWLGTFYHGLAPACINGRIGYLNPDNKVVIPAKFDRTDIASDFELGTAIVSVKGKYGIINTKGKYAVKPLYDEITRSKTVYIVKKGKQYGVLNKDGKVILKAKYTGINGGNSIIAYTGDKAMIYNLQGKALSKTLYKNLSYEMYLSNGYSIMTYESNGKMGAVVLH